MSAMAMMAVAVSPLMVVPTVIPIITGVAVMVPVPVFRMAWGHVRVDGPGKDHGCGPGNNHGGRPNHDRVSVNDRRREIADV